MAPIYQYFFYSLAQSDSLAQATVGLYYTCTVIKIVLNVRTANVTVCDCQIFPCRSLIRKVHVLDVMKKKRSAIAPVSDEPEVFLPKYMYCQTLETAILHAAHFRRVVNVISVYNRQNEVKLLDFLTGWLEWPPSTGIFFYSLAQSDSLAQTTVGLYYT